MRCSSRRGDRVLAGCWNEGRWAGAPSSQEALASTPSPWRRPNLRLLPWTLLHPPRAARIHISISQWSTHRDHTSPWGSRRGSVCPDSVWTSLLVTSCLEWMIRVWSLVVLVWRKTHVLWIAVAVTLKFSWSPLPKTSTFLLFSVCWALGIRRSRRVLKVTSVQQRRASHGALALSVGLIVEPT